MSPEPKDRIDGASTERCGPAGRTQDVSARDFRARGTGVTSLTPDGYDQAVDKIIPAAEYLAEQDVKAIMVVT